VNDGIALPGRAVRWLLAGLGVALVVLVAAVVWAGTTPAAAPSTTSPASTILASPTPKDACSHDNPCADTPIPPSPGAPVTVLVTSAGWDPARSVAWVAGDIAVLDPGGTCTATWRQGQTQVVQQTPAEPGPATTTCAVEVAQLGAGQWSVSLSYSSAEHSGTGDDVSVKVP